MPRSLYAEQIQKRRQILDFIASGWRTSGRAYREASLIRSFPTNLRKDLCEYLGPKIGDKVCPILNGFPPITLMAVYSRLMPILFQEKATVYRRLDIGGSLFIISEGIVSLTAVDRKVRDCGNHDLKMIFGEESLFRDLCPSRLETAIVKSKYLDCLQLTEVSCRQIERNEPELISKLREFSMLRAALLGNFTDDEQDVTPGASRTLRKKGLSRIESVIAEKQTEIKDVLLNMLEKQRDKGSNEDPETVVDQIRIQLRDTTEVGYVAKADSRSRKSRMKSALTRAQSFFQSSEDPEEPETKKPMGLEFVQRLSGDTTSNPLQEQDAEKSLSVNNLTQRIVMLTDRCILITEQVAEIPREGMGADQEDLLNRSQSVLPGQHSQQDSLRPGFFKDVSKSMANMSKSMANISPSFSKFSQKTLDSKKKLKMNDGGTKFIRKTRIMKNQISEIRDYFEDNLDSEALFQDHTLETVLEIVVNHNQTPVWSSELQLNKRSYLLEFKNIVDKIEFREVVKKLTRKGPHQDNYEAMSSLMWDADKWVPIRFIISVKDELFFHLDSDEVLHDVCIRCAGTVASHRIDQEALPRGAVLCRFVLCSPDGQLKEMALRTNSAADAVNLCNRISFCGTIVKSLLSHIGMKQHVEVLLQHKVDIDALSLATPEDLHVLGIPFGECERILEAAQPHKARRIKSVADDESDWTKVKLKFQVLQRKETLNKLTATVAKLRNAHKDHIYFDGLVQKRGHLNQSYKVRFFVLENGLLEYYKPHHVFGRNGKQIEGWKDVATPQGTIALHGATVFRRKKDEGNDIIYSGNVQSGCFEICSDGRVYHCRCPTFAQAAEWFRKIDDAIQHVDNVEKHRSDTARYSAEYEEARKAEMELMEKLRREARATSLIKVRLCLNILSFPVEKLAYHSLAVRLHLPALRIATIQRMQAATLCKAFETWSNAVEDIEEEIASNFYRQYDGSEDDEVETPWANGEGGDESGDADGSSDYSERVLDNKKQLTEDRERREEEEAKLVVCLQGCLEEVREEMRTLCADIKAANKSGDIFLSSGDPV